MSAISIIFGILGGIALFLYGMIFLSEGLQKVAGNNLKRILEKITSGRLKGVATGAAITAVIQSSSVTTVTLIGLLNAGIITLAQAIPVIMGADIGTTITSQLIAFKIGALAYPIISIGFLMFFLGKRKKIGYVGQVVLGFGLLFLGMNIMSQGVSPLKENPAVLGYLVKFGAMPLLGMLIGAIFTGIIQSSSATTAIIIALGMNNLITLNSAIALVFGANMGTCVTALIASIGSSLSGKRAALAHILIKIIGVIIFLPFIAFFAKIVMLTSPSLPRQIANAHTIFNVLIIVLLLPLSSMLTRLVIKLKPGEEIKIDKDVKFLDLHTLNIPAIAILQAEKEISRMAHTAKEMIEGSWKAIMENDMKECEMVRKKEELVDNLDNEIESFLIKVAERELSEEQSRRVNLLIHILGDIERVGDHAHNISELAERKANYNVPFSREAAKELTGMFKKTDLCFSESLKVLKKYSKKKADRVLELETEIDGIQKQLEANHFRRLKQKLCNPQAGPIFIDLVRNLERVSDHAHNIVYALVLGF